jgi:long-chain fatty acid transport protein
LRSLATIIVAVLASGSLHAQGVSIHSHGSCALARNSTGVAEPCTDGSAVFYNPAALVNAGGVASAGAMALYTKATFTFDENGQKFDSRQPILPAPHVWLAVPITQSIAAGIGAWAPFGLTTTWPIAFEGRFFGYDNTLQVIYIQPTLAARLLGGQLALGAGVVAATSSIELNRRIDLARTTIPGTNLTFGEAFDVDDGTDFANATLKVDDWAYSFHLGIQFRPSDRWSLGVRYLNKVKLDLNGTATFSQIATGFEVPTDAPIQLLPPGTPIDPVLAPLFLPGGPLGDQTLTTELTMPSQVVVGLRYALTEVTDLFLDYQWTSWEDFDQAVLNFAQAPNDTVFLDFHNASTFRFAVEVAPGDQFTYRGGLLYNTDAAPDVTVTPLLPEAPRTSFAGGVGYKISERFTADVGLELLLQNTRRGSVRPRESRSETAAQLNVGDYSALGLFGAITLSYRFGRARD